MAATYDEDSWTYDMPGATYDGDGGVTTGRTLPVLASVQPGRKTEGSAAGVVGVRGTARRVTWQ